MNHNNPTLTLVVLAAGMGSRYGGLKQIDPVGPHGETVLDYSVYDALRAGFNKVVFVIRRDIEQAFREKVGSRFEGRVEVSYVMQELDRLPAGKTLSVKREKPLGTGHAVWCAVEAVREPFAMINADDFYGADAFMQLAEFLRRIDVKSVPAQCCMVGYPLANTLSEHGTVSRGVCEVGSDGLLRGVQEWTAIERRPEGARQVLADGGVRQFTGRETVSMNCWGFSQGIFASLERQLCEFLDQNHAAPKSEFYIPSVVARLITDAEATCAVLPTSAQWFGITYKEDRAQVVKEIQTLINAKTYPSKLLA